MNNAPNTKLEEEKRVYGITGGFIYSSVPHNGRYNSKLVLIKFLYYRKYLGLVGLTQVNNKSSSEDELLWSETKNHI